MPKGCRNGCGLFQARSIKNRVAAISLCSVGSYVFKRYRFSSATMCGRSSGAVCFGGRLDCVDQLCQPLSNSDICAACTSGTDCDSNICVHHTFSGTNTEIDEQLCLEACPPADGSALSCPSGMSCKRLDGVLFEKVGD